MLAVPVPNTSPPRQRGAARGRTAARMWLCARRLLEKGKFVKYRIFLELFIQLSTGNSIRSQRRRPSAFALPSVGTSHPRKLVLFWSCFAEFEAGGREEDPRGQDQGRGCQFRTKLGRGRVEGWPVPSARCLSGVTLSCPHPHPPGDPPGSSLTPPAPRCPQQRHG